MDHDRRWRVAERYHVLFLRRSFLDLVLVCGGRLSADFESHFSQNIFVAYSRNPVNNNLQVDEIKALVFNTNTRYDIILGSDFLLKAGININYVERNLSWFGISIPLTRLLIT